MELYGQLLIDPPRLQSHGGIVTPLLRRYKQDARNLPRRENTSPYRTWVSEVMLQQTRGKAVRPRADACGGPRRIGPVFCPQTD